jgi:hypothetical protein
MLINHEIDVKMKEQWIGMVKELYPKVIQQSSLNCRISP